MTSRTSCIYLLPFLPFFSFLLSLLVFNCCSIVVRSLFNRCSFRCSLCWYLFQLTIEIKRHWRSVRCSICCSLSNSFRMRCTLLSEMFKALAIFFLPVVNWPGPKFVLFELNITVMSSEYAACSNRYVHTARWSLSFMTIGLSNSERCSLIKPFIDSSFLLVS